MSILRALWPVYSPNCDSVGLFKLTAADIESDRLAAHEEKLRRAREYLTTHNITPRALYHSKGAE